MGLLSMLKRIDELCGRSFEEESLWPDVLSDENWLMVGEHVGYAEKAEPILEAFTTQTGEQGFYITYYAGSGDFTYCHWRAGKRLRTLEYGNEIGNSETAWKIVEGEPEPWERSVLFKGNRLLAALSSEPDYDPADPGCCPEARQRLEAYWRSGAVAKGETYPWPAKREVADEILEHYRLPSPCFYSTYEALLPSK